MFGYEYKTLLLLLTFNFILHKSYADTEDNNYDGGANEPEERIMMPAYDSPFQYPRWIAPHHGHLTSGFLGAAPVNSLLVAYLNSKDGKRAAPSRAHIDHYVRMLMDGLLEEWRPFHPHTDAEALQMVRDFIASRDISSDLTHLKPEHATHEEWRERLKHLLFHYVKQPYVKQHRGLQRALKWYLNRLKHTIWVRRRLSEKRIGITRMNLVFNYLQALDNAANQREYRFDIYKEIERTAALKKRLVELSTLPEVRMNPQLATAFNYYIGKLTEALEETEKHKSLSEIPIRNIPISGSQQQIFPKKITTYVDIVQDFIERTTKLVDTKTILDGQSLDRVGGIRKFLEHYSATAEVKQNATLSEAIDTFLSKLKKLPSHHKLDTHLKRETIQKMVTKYEVVYEYLSKLEWKKSGTAVEALQRALQNPEIQKNATLMDAIQFYLEHSPKEEEEEEAEEEQAVEEEKIVGERAQPVEQEAKTVKEEKMVGERAQPDEQEVKSVGEENIGERAQPVEQEVKSVEEENIGERAQPGEQEVKSVEEENIGERAQPGEQEVKSVEEENIEKRAQPVEQEVKSVEEENIGERAQPVEQEVKSVEEENIEKRAQPVEQEVKSVEEENIEKRAQPVEQEVKSVEEENIGERAQPGEQEVKSVDEENIGERIQTNEQEAKSVEEENIAGERAQAVAQEGESVEVSSTRKRRELPESHSSYRMVDRFLITPNMFKDVFREYGPGNSESLRDQMKTNR